MELTIDQLALLIELTEVELIQMKKIIDDEQSSEREADDASEHTMQLIPLSSSLKKMYENSVVKQKNIDVQNNYSSDEEATYEELIADIHSRYFSLNSL